MPTLRVTATSALLCVIALLIPIASASCSSQDEPTFSCPNCGGITVSDCDQCDGFLFTDHAQGVCYDRDLFSNDDEMSFLWVDM